MKFTPQIYKIIDKKNSSFINMEEIRAFLEINPTSEQVEAVIKQALKLKRLSLAQTATLLRAPKEDRAKILEAASKLKEAVYGNRIVLFAPLYVGNLCSNSCDYCAFARENTLTARKTLSHSELLEETAALNSQGHRRLILVWGEHALYSATTIAKNVQQVYSTGEIRRLNINAAPLSVEGFREVAEAGIGTYQVFQETYNPEIYKQHHLAGKKSDYDYRLTAFDRAMEGGIDDVGLGVLFGLNPCWEEEVLGLVRHTNHLEALFNVGPHTISFPRMTPAAGAKPSQAPISDEDFIFAIAVLRLAVPYAGLILTARETPEFRSRAIKYGITQIDGGTKLEIGGYNSEEETQGDAQFTLCDNRSLSEIIRELVLTNKIPSFCTACYRKGRTGEHFMSFSTTGHIKELCAPNAILSFAEYLEDFASKELRTIGYDLIDKELGELKNKAVVLKKLEQIKGGERDLFF